MLTSPRSLYRRALKLTLDWSVQRSVWRGQALYIRSLFERQKDVMEPRKQKVRHWQDNKIKSVELTTSQQALIDEAEALLEKWKHPDPYRPPTAPGGTFPVHFRTRPEAHLALLGSKYERNLPAPILDRKFSFIFTFDIIVLTATNSSATNDAVKGFEVQRFGAGCGCIGLRILYEHGEGTTEPSASSSRLSESVHRRRNAMQVKSES
jgi:NADH dehydrogenase (ubiquinone) 1 beta subcomplex subunit 9